MFTLGSLIGRMKLLLLSRVHTVGLFDTLTDTALFTFALDSIYDLGALSLRGVTWLKFTADALKVVFYLEMRLDLLSLFTDFCYCFLLMLFFLIVFAYSPAAL